MKLIVEIVWRISCFKFANTNVHTSKKLFLGGGGGVGGGGVGWGDGMISLRPLHFGNQIMSQKLITVDQQ